MGVTLDITKTQKGPCRVWFGLAVPAAGTKLTIDANGEPDATQNPNRKLVGLTDAGASASVGKTLTEEFFDELTEAQNVAVDKTEMSIKVDAAQVLDPDIIAQATNGIGTAATFGTIAGYTVGIGTLTYTSVAAIAPTLNDPSKFIVFHLYKAYNDAPFDIELSKTKRAKISLNFKGVGIATRAKSDTLGSIIPSM